MPDAADEFEKHPVFRPNPSATSTNGLEGLSDGLGRLALVAAVACASFAAGAWWHAETVAPVVVVPVDMPDVTTPSTTVPVRYEVEP